MTDLVQSQPALVQVDGLWWPAVRGAKDHVSMEIPEGEAERLTPEELEAANKLRSRHGRYARHERDSDHAIKHCKQRRTCVQAGGHIGIWPLRLASKFERVITFEPEPTNWACLKKNTEHVPNITTYNMGLDQHEGLGRLAFNGRNIGGHKCRPPDYTREGDTIIPIRMMSIDSLGLTDVDFVCLDIEGYEARALRGAEQTVKRCKPVIMVESWLHGDKIGDPEEKLWAWFKQHGYREVGKVSHDHVWVHGR